MVEFNLMDWVMYKYRNHFRPGQIANTKGNILLIARSDGTSFLARKRDVHPWDPRKLKSILQSRANVLSKSYIRAAIHDRSKKIDWVQEEESNEIKRTKYFYVIREGEDSNIYKIGNSYHPEKRRMMLQTGNSNNLKIVLKVPVEDGFESETNVKNLLRKNHVAREFYRIDDFHQTRQDILRVI